MMEDLTFNKDFEKEHAKKMIRRIQSKLSLCIFCGIDCTTIKRCGKCKVATYCGRDCQTTHWKNHKHSCRIWWDSKHALYKMPFGYKMFARDYFGEEDFDRSMDMHAKFCIEELVRCNIKIVHALVDCVELLGKVYLNIGITFLNNDLEDYEISCFNMHLVDEGQEAINNINRGTGTIGTAAKQMVLEGMQRFLVQLEEGCHKGSNSTIDIQTLTYGRGLMNVCDNKSFQQSVTFVRKGKQSSIIWLPDMAYAMENMCSSVMNTALNHHGI